VAEKWFRNADARFPFLRDDVEQRAARWHSDGDGPVQYLADTPDGAWAEFLRHEGIVDETDLAGINRDLWAVEVELDDELIGDPQLPLEALRGDRSTYETCQHEAARLRSLGVTGLIVPTAGLRDDAAGGQGCVDGSLQERASRRDGRTMVLFGVRPTRLGWRCCHRGRPDARVIDLVRRIPGASG
jgi:RES domain